MNLPELSKWQWQSYADFHQSRINLLLHIVLVPGFLIANLHLLWALFNGSYISTAASLAIMLLSIVLQGGGHKQEPNPSIPFTSPSNAIARLLIEQWINFPRFVLSGNWWRVLKSAQ